MPLLSDDDLAAVARQQGMTSRNTTVVSRGLQRLMLGRYLDVDPALVAIARSCDSCGSPAHGRPSSAATDVRLDYSVSHSGQWVAMAVVGPGRVGFDLELPNDEGLDDLAGYILGEEELPSYRRIPASERSCWLYRTWTRKEAVLKATGTGLSVEPAQVKAGPTYRVPSSAASPLAGRTLHLSSLACWPGYAAAVASTTPLDVVLARRVDRP